MVSLRPFQATAATRIRGAYMAGLRRVLFVLPTGGGKTYTFVHIAEQAAIRGNRVCILVHRQELVDQSSRSLHAIGCNHGVIASGYRQDLRQGVQVASVQTLARRLHTIPADFFQLLIVDEAHHAVAGTWAKVLAAMPRAHILGVTATPERLDGRGLGDQFDALIEGPDAGWLTEQGFLVRARVFAPPGIDMGGIRRFDTRKGHEEAEARLRQGQAMGDAVSHYRRTIQDTHNGTAIAFCCSVAHAEAVAEAFRAQGIAAATLDGAMDRGIRRRTIADLGTGQLKVLTSCDIVSEGTDIPSVTGAILLRPTDSLGLHLQQVGRVLRPAPGKTCLLRGSMVLTNKGLVPIERVTIDHKVWDGLEFVQHSGAICQGRKAVITHDGITATPDHLVMTLHGWQQLAQAKAYGWRIVDSGAGRRPIRVNTHLFQKSNRNILEFAGRRDLHEMRLEWNGPLPQHEEGAERLSRVRSAPDQDQSPYLALQALPVARATLQQSVLSRVSQLRRQGDRVQISISMARGRVDRRAPWSPSRQKGSDRQDQQQRALRTWQSPLGIPADQLPQHQEEHRRGCAVLGVPGQASGSEIRRLHAQEVMQPWSIGRGNSRPLEHPILQTEGEVWDILNAGPRNCFTANDRLVHNCAIINDHVGNTLRHGLPTDPREWSLEGRPKDKARKASDAIPIRICPACFSAIPSACNPCSECGHEVPVARRELQVVDGTLQELNSRQLGSEMRRAERREVAKARTRDELEAIARERGYKPGWVAHMLAARRARQCA